MDRPALKKLLDDVRARGVDVIERLIDLPSWPDQWRTLGLETPAWA